ADGATPHRVSDAGVSAWSRGSAARAVTLFPLSQEDLPVGAQGLAVAGQQGVGPGGLRDATLDEADAAVGQGDVHAAAVPALGSPVVAAIGPRGAAVVVRGDRLRLEHGRVALLIPVQAEIGIVP